MDNVITLSGVTKEYSGPPALRALNSVDWRVDSHDFVTVAGRSGSGKSTLLRMIGLLDTPTLGDVTIFGTSTAALSDREKSHLRARQIGFVFQAFQLLSNRTVSENVLLGDAYAPQGTRSERFAKAAHLLESVGLAGRELSMPNELSGGQQQRVALARALMCQPSLLLCDEPTGNLDSTSTSLLMDLFEDIRSTSNIAIVIATHDSEVQDRVDDRIVLVDGRISIEGR